MVGECHFVYDCIEEEIKHVGMVWGGDVLNKSLKLDCFLQKVMNSCPLALKSPQMNGMLLDEMKSASSSNSMINEDLMGAGGQSIETMNGDLWLNLSWKPSNPEKLRSISDDFISW